MGIEVPLLFDSRLLRGTGTRLLPCFPLSLLKSLLDVQPPTVGSAVEVLFYFPDGVLVCLLRSAGAVVVQPDGQLLERHALLLRLADPQMTAHQVQLPR